MGKYWSNGPKTYGVVYVGTQKVVKYDNKPQYFRSNESANIFLPFLQNVFVDCELEVIQTRRTMRERLIKEVRKDNSKSKRGKLKKSPFLKHLKQDQKDYAKDFKLLNKYKEKRIEGEDLLEEYF